MPHALRTDADDDDEDTTPTTTTKSTRKTALRTLSIFYLFRCGSFGVAAVPATALSPRFPNTYSISKVLVGVSTVVSLHCFGVAAVPDP